MAGCTAATFENLIGQPTAERASDGEPLDKQLEGTWIVLDKEQQPKQRLQVEYPGDGTLRVGESQWRAKEFSTRSQTLIITENDGQLFLHFDASLNADGQVASSPPKYLTFLLRFEPGGAKLFAARIDRLRDAVRSGELSGFEYGQPVGDDGQTPEGDGSVFIDSPSEQLAKEFTADRIDKWFNTAEPLQLKRVAKRD